MMSNKMICEPNTSLPQKIDIDTLRQSDKPYFAAQEIKLKTLGTQQLLSDVNLEYYVLPMFNHQNDHLKSVLSLKNNSYLACKWKKFMYDVPEMYIHIMLYTDYKKRQPIVRRMNLNGQFYGIDYKLAPFPVLDDPRQYKQISVKKENQHDK